MAKDQTFIHLHTHSHYSLLAALPQIPELVRAAVACDMPALALTDNGSLYGAIEFYKERKNIGLKPIIGVDAYLAPRTRFDKEGDADLSRTRLVLLVQNQSGYKNLLKLVTASHIEGLHEKPRVDRELLAAHVEGLIAIIPAAMGETSALLRTRNAAEALEVAAWYQKTFGKERVFLEITHHPEISGHQELMAQIQKLSTDSGVPLVAAHDTYYLRPEDAAAERALVRIQGNRTDTGFDEDEPDLSFIDQETARRYFADMPEALATTEKIACMCNLELKLGAWIFPPLQIPEGVTPDEELRRQAYAGLPDRHMEDAAEIRTRIDYELDIIAQKAFSPYFLVVADLLRFAP